MCCFVLCYFANTKIGESFRIAKIQRTFFGNTLASKFAGCVGKDDSGSDRLRESYDSKAGNSIPQVRTEQVGPEKFCGFVFFS